jgi:hypothetical protein
MKIIKVTPLQPAKVNELYINSNYIVHFYKNGKCTEINVLEAGELTSYYVSETPEQLMEALREETFPVEHFIEELKDSGNAIPISGYMFTN